jgi:hypothetical protein
LPDTFPSLLIDAELILDVSAVHASPSIARITHLIAHPRYEHFCHGTQGCFIHKITIVTTVPKVAHIHFGAAKFLSSPEQVAKLIFRN